MRIVAIVQVYNGERFIAGCIEHLRQQGVDVYLIDDASTDQTVVPVELAWSGGHQVRFEGLAIAPRSLYMRHYLYLSRAHAIEKYVHHRPFAQETLALGWHGFRPRLRPEMIALPSARALNTYHDDERLDPSHPRQRHLLDDLVAAAAA